MSIVQLAGIASIVLDAKRAQVDPRQLQFHRSRIEPTDSEEVKVRNERRLALFDSWLEQPINEIYVRDGDYAIADGNERVAGALLQGVAGITVCLLPAGTTDAELDSFSVLTDVHKTKLRPFELAGVIRRYFQATGVKKGEAAATFRMAQSHLTKLLSVFDCIPEAQAAAEAGKLTVEDWYAVSGSPDPQETLRVRLAGGGRKAVQASARPKPPQQDGKPPERFDRLPIPSPGAIVLVKAKKGQQPLDLAATRKLLKDALDKVDSAIQASYSIKTAARAWADTKDKVKKERKPRKPKAEAPGD